MPERLDCSYGITVWPEDGPERARLLEAADSRLYGMKREGEHGALGSRP
jgi:GGDEF domain-containing protein